jgi:hypothetical protein
MLKSKFEIFPIYHGDERYRCALRLSDGYAILGSNDC